MSGEHAEKTRDYHPAYPDQKLWDFSQGQRQSVRAPALSPKEQAYLKQSVGKLKPQGTLENNRDFSSKHIGGWQLLLIKGNKLTDRPASSSESTREKKTAKENPPGVRTDLKNLPQKITTNWIQLDPTGTVYVPGHYWKQCRNQPAISEAYQLGRCCKQQTLYIKSYE